MHELHGGEIVLATYGDHPELWEDDRPLAAALEERGAKWRAIPWDASDVDWRRARAVVLRSTWNYFRRRDEFLEWASGVAAVTRLWNPIDVVRWNTHKGYMLELERQGVPVTPTMLVPRGSSIEIAAALREHGWTRAVAKPAVSADSWETFGVDASPTDEQLARFARLVGERDMLLQRYIASVEDVGERCLVFIDGRLSHAVRKRSLFQGGRWAGPEGVPVPIERDEEALAIHALEAARANALPYARVDMARDAAGKPVLMELELAEPTLFFLDGPLDAASRLANALLR